MTKDASAIPENLYQYAIQCARGAQELQDWIRGVLEPALEDYERGGGQCLTIGEDTARAVAQAYYTDHDISAVGRAFEEAGRSGRLHGPVVTDSATINRILTSDAALARLGGELGHQMPMADGRDRTEKIDALMKRVVPHAGDPTFSAAFLNSLTPEQLHYLFTDYKDQLFATDPASSALPRLIVSALRGGELTPRAAAAIFTPRWVEFRSIEPLPLELLEHDPVAATNFAQLLTRQAVQGFASSPEFFKVLTLAVHNTHDPADVTRLVSAVSGGLGHPDDDLQRLNSIYPSLTEFMRESAKAMMGPPPKDPQRIEAWARQFGTNMREFKGIYTWISATYKLSGQTAEQTHQLLTTVAVAVGLAVVDPEVEPVALAMFYEGAIATGSSAVESYLNSIVPWPKGPDGDAKGASAEAAMKASSAAVLAAALFKAHLMEKPGPGNTKELLQKLGSDPANSPWAGAQYVKGTKHFVNLAALIAEMFGTESGKTG